MIIQCEKCGKKFDLDESLVKKEGSRLRCSVCKHIFVAYPPEELLLEDVEPLDNGVEELEKTFVQESPPLLDEVMTEDDLKDKDIDFDDVFDELPDMKEEELGAIPTARRRSRSRFLLFFLVILFALAASGAAINHLAPHLITEYLPFLKADGKKAIPDPGTRRLSFDEVEGNFFDSEESGKLYVIRGTVINNYPKKRSFVRVKCTILDNEGKAVKIKTVYAGNTFKDEELNILPVEKINRAMKKRHGMNGRNFNVAPGARIPFMIVFEKLPDNLSEFEVVAVSSSPGT